MLDDVRWCDLWSAGLLDRSGLAHARAEGIDARDWLGNLAATDEGARAAVDCARRQDELFLRRARLGPCRTIDVARESPGAATDSPFLVVAGEAPLRVPGSLAIVGTRRLDAAGRRLTEALVEQICQALPIRIVSGGAYGVDAVAQRVALRHGRETVVVLAGGLGHAGPSPHRDEYRAIVAAGGLIVTERPARAKPQQFEFVRRNRLIAWIADATLVVRAPEPSGALITAHWAFRMGRPVLATPGEPADPLAAGCHALLRRGARVCTGPHDIAAALGLGRQLALPGLSGGAVESAQQAGETPGGPMPAVVDAMQGESCTADILARRLGCSVVEVMAELLGAELAGLVEQDGLGRWQPRRGFAASGGARMLLP